MLGCMVLGGVTLRTFLSRVVGDAATSYIIAVALLCLYAYVRLGTDSGSRASKFKGVRKRLEAQRRMLRNLRQRSAGPIDKWSLLPKSLRNDSAYPLPERAIATSAPLIPPGMPKLSRNARARRKMQRAARQRELSEIRRSQAYLESKGLQRQTGASSIQMADKSKMDEGSGSLRSYLEIYGLSEYQNKFEEMGARDAKHLIDVHESDLQSIGMKKLEIRRLLRALKEDAK